MMATLRVQWPRILLFGDSITQFSFSAEGCWGALVADHFQRRADVVVRGFSGYNTRQCKALLPLLAGDLQGAVGGTVLLGANDASQEENQQQSVPLPEYVSNLKDIVWQFQKAEVSPVVITPPALDGRAWQRHSQEVGRPHTKEEELTATYAQACRRAAQDLGVTCVDLHASMLAQPQWEGLLCDGLHLSRRGSELLASLLLPALENTLRHHLPPRPLLPHWDELDRESPIVTISEWCSKKC